MELPITFYYTDKERHAERVLPGSVSRCLIGALVHVRRGKSLCLDAESIGCFGGRRYLGFAEEIMQSFEYFLSHGIPGKLEGEHYKKSPELVKDLMQKAPVFKAPSQYAVFKRWDRLEDSDEPEVVIFFARPDVISGLFTLAGFDTSDINGVYSPFGAGCSSIVQYPYLEIGSDQPRGIVGMFDVSARPYVKRDELSFAVPMKKFVTMIENMDDSFLMTKAWGKVRRRIVKK